MPPLELPDLSPISVTPIGLVVNNVTDPRRHDWSRVRSRLQLLPELAPALEGLAGFSHLIVVCWLHEVNEDERALRQVHPAGDQRLPARGVLALRTHHRPNPIAVSVVSVDAVDGTTVSVRGLDAIHGTPVLDIKPYLPPYDSVPDAKLAAWAR